MTTRQTPDTLFQHELTFTSLDRNRASDAWERLRIAINTLQQQRIARNEELHIVRIPRIIREDTATINFLTEEALTQEEQAILTKETRAKTSSFNTAIGKIAFQRPG